MTKKLILDLIKNSTNVEIDKVFDNGKKWEANVRGQCKTKTSNDGFSKKQLEQLQGLLNPIVQDIKEIKLGLDGVEKRLNGVERDIKEVKSRVGKIENVPTIREELI